MRKIALVFLARAANCFSAAPSQQATLETADNLSNLAEQLAKPPVSGLSARKLSKIYEYCALFAGPNSKEQWMQLYLPDLKADPTFGARRKSLAEKGYERCRAIIADGADVEVIRKKWLDHAAAAEDVVAQLILRQSKTPTQEDIVGFESELKRALNSRDPEAIWEAGRSLRHAGFDWSQLSGTPWPGKPVDGLRALFQWSACEMGLPCGAQSNLIRNFCIRGDCKSQDYGQWLKSFLTPEQFAAVQAQLPLAINKLKAGRGAELIFHN